MYRRPMRDENREEEYMQEEAEMLGAEYLTEEANYEETQQQQITTQAAYLASTGRLPDRTSGQFSAAGSSQEAQVQRPQSSNSSYGYQEQGDIGFQAPQVAAQRVNLSNIRYVDNKKKQPEMQSSPSKFPEALGKVEKPPIAMKQGGAQKPLGQSVLFHNAPPKKTRKPRASMPGQRKPCNCTKSQCLKLYCDCFANGEFCQDCNCRDCHNNLEHDEERHKAIKQSLDRNPNAFKPKIGVAKTSETDVERLHQKGCHCKKSGCLKNYCECFEAKVPCTDRCKCRGCQNTEHEKRDRYKDKLASSALMNLANAATSSASSVTHESRSQSSMSNDDDAESDGDESKDPKSLPWFYMTDEVVEAAAMCMIAQADECLREESRDNSDEEVEKRILNEFGRCLEQIIANTISSAKLPGTPPKL